MIATDAFWAAGIALELVLLILIFRRGLIATFPVFTSLVIFYIGRAVALFVLFDHISHPRYLSLYQAFSRLGPSLELLVGGEIAFRTLRNHNGWSRWAAAIATFLPLSTLAAASCMGIILPAMAEQGGTLLVGAAMMVLVVWMAFVRVRGAAIRLAAGFLAFNLAVVVADLVLRYAAVHHSVVPWIVASASKPLAWIAVVIFWILSLGTQRSMRPCPARSDLDCV